MTKSQLGSLSQQRRAPEVYGDDDDELEWYLEAEAQFRVILSNMKGVKVGFDPEHFGAEEEDVPLDFGKDAVDGRRSPVLPSLVFLIYYGYRG